MTTTMLGHDHPPIPTVVTTPNNNSNNVGSLATRHLNSPTPSTSTPVTDNRNPDLDDSPPEAAKAQPFLGTIQTPSIPKTSHTNNTMENLENSVRSESPQTIDMKTSSGATNQIPPIPRVVSSPRPNGNGHVRKYSGELIDPYFGGPGPQQPYLGASTMQGQYNMGYNGAPPQMLPSPRTQHRRTGSFDRGIPRPTHQRGSSLPLAPPFPSVPVLPDDASNGAGRLMQQGAPPQFRSPSPVVMNRKRSFSDGRGRQRSRSGSFSGSLPGLYGSMDENGSQTGGGHPNYQSGNWSPRQEFFKLTGTTNPPHQTRSYSRTGLTPPASPRANRMPPSPSGSQSMRNMGAYADMHVNFSQPGTPVRDAQQPMGGAIAPAPWGSVRGMPAMPYPVWDGAPESSASSPANLPPDGAAPGHGEAVFQARGRTAAGKRSAASVRKMHMRQQSAQLYMKEVKGVNQAPACRNVLFVLLFLFHLVGMAFLGKTYGLEAFFDDPTTKADDVVAVSYRNIIYVACLCGAFAVAVSTLALVIMTIHSKRLVQVALIFSIAMAFAWGTVGIGLSPKNFVPITGIIALALSVGYTFVAWDRIPFAAANLNAGLAGVRANAGTVIVAYAFQFFALLWTIYFTFVVIGVYDALTDGHLELSDGMEVFVYTVLGISYYWTFHVLMNIVQVTVAGVIGAWWFEPDAPPQLCGSAVVQSLFASLFYGFGSICFGSLLVGPVRLLRTLAAFFRPSQEESSLMCLHECLHCIQQCVTNCVDNLADQFNSWAYTYVGLYGYGLLDAGHRATELFHTRGWSMIVTDDLVPNVLQMVSFVIGGATGCFGILIQKMDNLGFTSFNQPVATAFLIGLLVGWVLTSVLFAIISSSVNAVIVCFAGSPVEFEHNHPELSSDMRTAWREVWPGCMDAVDMRVAMAMQTEEGAATGGLAPAAPNEQHPLLM